MIFTGEKLHPAEELDRIEVQLAEKFNGYDPGKDEIVLTGEETVEIVMRLEVLKQQIQGEMKGAGE